MCHWYNHERKQVFHVIMAGAINLLKYIIHFVKDRTQVDLFKKVIKKTSEAMHICFLIIAWPDSLCKFQ